MDKGFDEHDIPYDVLWLDIEHTDGKKYMTWDKLKFPTPDQMQKNLAAKGRKVDNLEHLIGGLASFVVLLTDIFVVS